jgi:hypothetical protein
MFAGEVEHSVDAGDAMWKSFFCFVVELTDSYRDGESGAVTLQRAFGGWERLHGSDD